MLGRSSNILLMLFSCVLYCRPLNKFYYHWKSLRHLSDAKIGFGPFITAIGPFTLAILAYLLSFCAVTN